MSEILIPVYRLHQPSFDSPCILGEPCSTCKQHQKCVVGHKCSRCRRGKPFTCERQVPAKPAFAVGVAEALRMVHHGEATFIHRNSALKLTYVRLSQLRDLSCKVDPEVMHLYAAGYRRVRIAVDLGWQSPPETATAAPGSQPSATPGFA